jgi:hypothetical protein
VAASDSYEAALWTRPTWTLTPLEGVGPLQFGMSVDEAASALPEALELRRFQAEPHYPQIVGIELGLPAQEPAVYEYFDGAGRLFCIAVDAGNGPQVTLNGTELTGGDPAELENWMDDQPKSTGGLRYGPRANPAINELGLVLRVQETARRLLTRPVLVGRDWADGCHDDYEGAIPECEWVGHLWPDPRFPDRPKVWSPAEYTPTWEDSPPF